MAAPVLLVDDDLALVAVIASALVDDGYMVASTTSMDEAIGLLSLHGPDGYGLVLSDSFARPPADPYMWLDCLRTHTSAPIVIASGLTPQVFGDWRARGFAALLPKPFDLDELTNLVVALYGRGEPGTL